MVLMPHLRYGSNSYSQLTVINEHIGGIKPFTPIYMTKPSGFPVYWGPNPTHKQLWSNVQMGATCFQFQPSYDSGGSRKTPLSEVSPGNFPEGEFFCSIWGGEFSGRESVLRGIFHGGICSGRIFLLPVMDYIEILGFLVFLVFLVFEFLWNSARRIIEENIFPNFRLMHC